MINFGSLCVSPLNELFLVITDLASDYCFNLVVLKFILKYLSWLLWNRLRLFWYSSFLLLQERDYNEKLVLQSGFWKHSARQPSGEARSTAVWTACSVILEDDSLWIFALIFLTVRDAISMKQKRILLTCREVGQASSVLWLDFWMQPDSDYGLIFFLMVQMDASVPGYKDDISRMPIKENKDASSYIQQ